MLRLLPFLLVLLVVLGCAKHEKGAASMAYADDGYAPAAPPPPPSPAREAPSKKLSSADRGESAEPEPQAEPRTDPGAPKPEAPARMVHYNGWLRLRVTRVDEGIDAVKALAEGAGGFVERIGADHVVVRVPVARFRETFEAARELGEDLDHSISADDVTEAFTATDLRLRTAKATRARLQALLAKSEDEQEKLQLLREIQRIGEEIDRLEAQVATLRSLADFSRITVELVPREALAWQGPEDETAELAWIRQLSPFRTDFPLETRKLPLDAPEGMVKLDERGPFVAESADNASIWSHRVRNRPLGDAAFWRTAIEERLAGDFAVAERVEIGGWQALRLVDRSEPPYTWVIALRVEGDWLQIVQVWYPSPAVEARYREAVRAVLAGGAA